MAQVYGTLVEAPNFEDFIIDGKYDRAKDEAATDAYLEASRKALKEYGYEGELVGEIITFGVGDGYAQYMIASVSPPRLIHLPLGDAWEIPEAHARGLKAKDLKQKVASKHAMAELFGKSRLKLA